MANKITIQNLINSLIRSNPALIDKTEHADVEDALLAAIYPDVTTVDQSNTSIITLNPALSASITYSANIYKQGRTVTINVVLAKSTTALINTWIFEVTNSEYLGKSVNLASSPSAEFTGIANFSDYTIQGTLKADNKFYTAIDGGIKQFTLTYQTLN